MFISLTLYMKYIIRKHYNIQSKIYKDKKALMSLDFLFSFIILIIISTLILGFVYSNLSNIYSDDENIQERLILDKVASEINTVSSKDQGYSTVIHLKKDVYGYSYYIRVNKNRITLYDTFNRLDSSIYPITIKNKYGSPISYINLNSGCDYNVSKEKINNQTFILFVQIN